MKTIAERWNEKYGRKIFAEQLDECGLPVLGFAIPSICSTEDLSNRQCKITVGSFRVVCGEFDRRHAERVVSIKSLQADGEALRRYCEEVLNDFVTTLPTMEE